MDESSGRRETFEDIEAFLETADGIFLRADAPEFFAASKFG